MVLMGLFMFTGKMNAVTGYLSKVSIAGNETENAKKQKNQSAAQQKNTGQDNTSGEKETSAGESKQEEKKENDQRETVPSIDFTLQDQYGNTHTLSEYKGKTVF